jgi:branched-chain amino acid transport system substrate-binding protein
MMEISQAARRAAVCLVALCVLVAAAPAQAADPIKVGMTLALTGGSASAGKMVQAAVDLWRDDVNARGGLLGRPVEIVVYDDQSNPANVPGLAIGINRQYSYPKYFSMVPAGPEGVNAFSKGFFEMAAKQVPKPHTVAILAADAEFAQSAAEGARQELKKQGFSLIYDKSYPPATTDFTAAVRALHAANADVVYVGAYPPDTVGIIRAANEIGLNPKIFGGAMVGMFITPLKARLGPVTDGLVISETFAPSSKLNFPGLEDVMKRYQVEAPKIKTDPLGYAFVPFGYAAGQVLQQAVTETKSLDHDQLAAYIHTHSFKTVVGEISFGKDGEWSKSRQLLTQFQSVEPNSVDQFRSGAKQPTLWPPEYADGKMIYPFENARKK